MCGIAGIIDFNIKDNIKDVENMLKSINFRGPNSKSMCPGTFFDIGAVRLAIVDFKSKSANQPFVSDNGNIIIIYNGEIYNHQDLRRTYLSGHSFSSKCDGEVLPLLYQKFGIRFIEKIKGMFSICIIDKSKSEIYLIRDRFGIKPLYYHFNQKKRSLIFCSEIHPIFLNKIDKIENHKETIRFFDYSLLHSTNETWFKNIFQICPGEYLKFSKTELKVEKYYNLEDNIDESTDFQKINYFDLEDKIFQIINKSFREHSIGDFKLGLHISSGLDSGLLACGAKEANLETECYSFGFEESEFNEIPGAKQISEGLNFKHTFTKINTNNIINEFEKNLNMHYEPFTSLRLLNHTHLYEKFKDSCKVILDGSGGDEIGGGYTYQKLAWVMDMINDGQENVVEKMKRKKNYLNDDVILRYSKKINTPAANIHEDGKFFEKFNFLNLNYTKENFVKLNKPFRSILRNTQYQDLMYRKLPRSLKYIDRASMRYSVEARVPFLDHELVEAMISIPTKYKLINGIQRFIHNRYIRKTLGTKFRYKNKKSLADPQTDWMRTYFRDYTLDILNSNSTKNDSIVDHKILSSKFNSFFKRKEVENSFYLFQCLCYLAWKHKILKNQKNI